MEQKLPSIAPNILKQMEGYTETYKAVSQELTKQGHYTRNQRRRGGGDQTTDNLANSLQTSEKQDWFEANEKEAFKEAKEGACHWKSRCVSLIPYAPRHYHEDLHEEG